MCSLADFGADKQQFRINKQACVDGQLRFRSQAVPVRASQFFLLNSVPLSAAATHGCNFATSNYTAISHFKV
ncbi:hypothetical protein SLEP1_g14743 [Rubroshorea leprosula]|uniref:Uncharacterized protein n=1 Tax=Rubroshorea leprosula TaxID=152421 RepID=A0AAV5IK23_9ROSI|nr:hypothetical protein SLEP1_g14743 [Rubroshorea leprosula]